MPLLTVKDDRGRFTGAPRAGRMVAALGAGMLLFGALPLGVFVVVEVVREGSPGVTAAMTVLVGACGIVAFAWPRIETARAVELARELGRCPSCGADLTLTPPEEDGCTVCPGCEAAWRIDHEDIALAELGKRDDEDSVDPA